MTDRSVSVVIATHDRPELLRRAIAAVLEQDHDGSLEIIVVFDRSEPAPSLAEHPAVVDRDDRQIFVTTNTRSPGLAGARNSGVAQATHEWIAFCDDDDEWLPGKLAAQFEALDANPGARVSTTGVFIHFEGEDTVRIPDAAMLTFEGFLNDRMTEVHPSATLVSSELIAELGDVDETIPGGYGEDYDWLLRAARLSPFAVAAQPLVRVHWHGASFFFEKWKIIDDALEFLVEKHPEFHEHPAGLARIRGQQAIARGAMKQRGAAVRTAFETTKLKPTEKRAPVALLIAAGVPASAVLRTAHKFGKGL
jgi:glycosyltransferase involved in cell wall biosynthesis